MSRKPYVRPVFVKQQVGVMNKFGNSYYRSYCSTIDNARVGDLATKFGSPLFVFSQKTLQQRYRELYAAFSTRYPNVQVAWPYKTNYLDAVCAVLHREGAVAEVVSDFEYDKAMRLGIDGRCIVLNGPYKSACLLKRAFRDKAVVNIDNFDELYLAESCAREIGLKVPVGIRVNLDTGTYPQWFKFGFNLESGQAREAVNRISRSAHLVLNGLHTHIGTFVLEPNQYAIAAEKLISFMQETEAAFKVVFEYLDIGGGFPSRNRLKGVYLPPDVSVPNIDEYAEAICNALLRNLRPNEFPKLYVESGRMIADEAGYLIATVTGRKQLPDGIRSYLIDAGINLLYTSAWYNFTVQPEDQLSGIPEPSRLYGPLCMNIDLIAESVYLPPIPVGGRLVIHPVGAYNTTQWMQFITYRPAIVMIMEDGKVERIRRAETLEDIVGCEYLPESLKLTAGCPAAASANNPGNRT